MKNNRYWTAIFAAIGNLLSALVQPRHDPGVCGGLANPPATKPIAI